MLEQTKNSTHSLRTAVVGRDSSSRSQLPYTVPLLFSPAASDLPTFSELPPTILSAMQQSIDTAEGLLVQLDNVIQTPSWMHETLLPVSEALGDLLQLLLPALQALHDQAASGLNSAAAQTIIAADMSEVMVEACTIYDDYFQVVRVFPMQQLQFTAQVVYACKNILHDLPYTLIDRMHITVLIRTMWRMLCVLTTDAGAATDNDFTVPDNGIRSSSFAKAHDQYVEQQQEKYAAIWQSNAVHEGGWTEQVAHYRWKVGHHFFNLCTMFCRHLVRQAHAAIEQEEITAAVQQLRHAEQFLRGGMAAMWYAGDFPTSVYKNVIRPSMVRPGAPAGFSGDQNADYNRMKLAKDRLKVFLRSQYSATLDALPDQLWQALMNVHEADVQDVENHLLIAANKVGVDQSLAQKEWMSELPDTAHAQAAIDILREMAEMRRREF